MAQELSGRGARHLEMGNKSSLMLQDEEIGQISHETGFSAQQIERLYARFTHLDRDSCGSLSKNDLLSIPELAINPLCDRIIEIFFADQQQKQQHRLRQRQRHRQWQRHRQSRQQQPPAQLAPAQHLADERINFRQFMRVLAAFRSSLNCSPSSSSTSSSSSSSSSSSAGAAASPTPSDANTSAAGRGGAHEGAHSPGDNLLRDKLVFLFKIYDVDNDGRISFADLRAILKLMVGSHIGLVQLDKIATRAFVELDRDRDGFIEFNEFSKVFAGKDMNLFRLSV